MNFWIENLLTVFVFFGNKFLGHLLETILACALQEDRLEALAFRPKTMAETDAFEVWFQIPLMKSQQIIKSLSVQIQKGYQSY